jgi:ABC-type phosphate/phosphonate transport system ATPase subunit
MSANTLTLELSGLLAMPETELVRKGLLALIEKEIRMAEDEIASIRERYDVFSKESLYKAVEEKKVAGHPAWEDYIVWKNKESHITKLRQLAEKA